jgi:hypothetical protein
MQEKSRIERIRLQIRKHLFLRQNRFLNKLLNLDAYLFLASWLRKIIEINSIDACVEINVQLHRSHYFYIRNQAQSIFKFI